MQKFTECIFVDAASQYRCTWFHIFQQLIIVCIWTHSSVNPHIHRIRLSWIVQYHLWFAWQSAEHFTTSIYHVQKYPASMHRQIVHWISCTSTIGFEDIDPVRLCTPKVIFISTFNGLQVNWGCSTASLLKVWYSATLMMLWKILLDMCIFSY